MSDNSTNLPFGMQSLQPGSMKTISQGKLATFAVGQQKKSRFQKAREEKEQKRKQEELEAASVYESFVASFEVDEDNSKTFVRGGRIQEDNKAEPEEAGGRGSGGGAAGELYRLQAAPRSVPPPAAGTSTSTAPETTGTAAGAGGKQSNMALLLEEMKERDSERALRQRDAGRDRDRDGGGGGSRERSGSRDFASSSSGSPLVSFLDTVAGTGGGGGGSWGGTGFGHSSGAGAGGSFDNGDPFTTNLYVGNLAPSITEERLCEIFGVFGPVNSAKVMWPRTEEERARKRNCGFVSFVHRADAEDALSELNDSTLEEHRMSVGWGKAVRILATPRYTRPPAPPLPPPPAPAPGTGTAPETAPALAAGPSAGQGSSEMGVLAQESPQDDTAPPATPLPSALPPLSAPVGELSAQQGQEQQKEKAEERVVVVLPVCSQQRRLVDTLARYVAVDGDALEQAVRAREAENPAYRFLLPRPWLEGGAGVGRQEGAEEQAEELALRRYYRWRTLAFAMGCGEESWREQPFRLVQGGPLWVPPPAPVPAHPHSSSLTAAAAAAGALARRSSSRSHSRSRSRSRSAGRRGERLREGSRTGHRSRSRSRDRDRDRSRDRRDRSRDRRDRDRSRDRRDRRDKAVVIRAGERDASEVSSQWRKRGGSSASAQPSSAEQERKAAVAARRAQFAGMTGAQIERAKAQERGARRARLSQRKFDEFSGILEALTLERSSVRAAMGFALDNTEAAADLVSVLCAAVLSPAASPPLKVARLYLLSDILHNSGSAVKNASLFRGHVQAALPGVMDGLNRWQREQQLGRMSATLFEERVLGVLRVWSDWAIFAPAFLHGLEAVFFRSDSDLRRCEEGGWPVQQQEGGGDEDEAGGRRRARFAGLMVSTGEEGGGALGEQGQVQVPVAVLLQQLSFVEDFSRSRSQLHPALAPQLGGDQDIDGMAMDEDENLEGFSIRPQVTDAGSESIFGRFAAMQSQCQPPHQHGQGQGQGYEHARYYDDDGDDVEDDDDDVDGAPLDEDEDEEVDGAPMDA